jgi:hypothetical protein
MEQRKLAPPEEHELKSEESKEWCQEQELKAQEGGRSLEEGHEQVRQLLNGIDLRRLVL